MQCIGGFLEPKAWILGDIAAAAFTRRAVLFYSDVREAPGSGDCIDVGCAAIDPPPAPFWPEVPAMRSVPKPGPRSAADVLPASLPRDWFPFFTRERIATLKRLGRQQHPWIVFVADMARRESAYNDRGQWDVLMHFATGDPSWARSAIAQLLQVFHETPPSLNDTREEGVYWPLNYVWLKAHMTPSEKATFRQRMRNWCEHYNDLNAPRADKLKFGTRVGDSDVCVGHYFGFLLTLAATRDEPLVEDLIDKLGPNGATLADQWAAIARYCEQAEGGEWVESSAYNQGTLSLAFLGASALGIGNFPPLAKLGRQVAASEAYKLTPDLKDAAEWGDESWPRDPERWARVGLLALLVGAGLDQDGQARKLIDDLTQGVPLYPTYWLDLYRALWVFDPSSPVPKVKPAYGFRRFGVGLVTHRGPRHLLSVFGPGRQGVDHDVAHCADVRLYLGGEWVVDHPMGYDPHSDAVNAGAPAGLGKMWQSGIVSAEGDLESCRVLWETSGGATWAGYYDPPPAFLKRYRRTIDFAAATGKITVVDEFDGADPERLPKFDRYYADTQAAIRAREALWVVRWHAPTEPRAIDHGFSWKTGRGRTVVLTHDATRSAVTKTTKENLRGYLSDAERTGWVIRLLSDVPRATIRTWIVPGS